LSWRSRAVFALLHGFGHRRGLLCDRWLLLRIDQRIIKCHGPPLGPGGGEGGLVQLVLYRRNVALVLGEISAIHNSPDFLAQPFPRSEHPCRLIRLTSRPRHTRQPREACRYARFQPKFAVPAETLGEK